MELKDLKRGMRITLGNSTTEIIDKISVIPPKVYPVCDKSYYGNFKDDLTNIYNEFDIVKVEDLDFEGKYYTIWEREEPKFYIKPKGMDMRSGVCMNLNIETNKWFSCFSDGEDKYFKSQFTIEEMIELGLDPDNFDKELVC